MPSYHRPSPVELVGAVLATLTPPSGKSTELVSQLARVTGLDEHDVIAGVLVLAQEAASRELADPDTIQTRWLRVGRDGMSSDAVWRVLEHLHAPSDGSRPSRGSVYFSRTPDGLVIASVHGNGLGSLEVVRGEVAPAVMSSQLGPGKTSDEAVTAVSSLLAVSAW